MALNEAGINIVPQYTDFSVKFTNITKDGTTLNFATVGDFIFVMASSIDSNPFIIKSASGNGLGGPHISSYIINAGANSVTVAVEASGANNALNNAYGTFYVALYAQTSGRRITHNQKYITITPQVRFF